MKLIIFFLNALFSNVLPDSIFATITTDSINKVSIRPKFTAPQKFFDRWYSAKYLAGGNTLYRPNNLGQAICWNRLY